MAQHIEVGGGKYTVVIHDSGHMEALRHGEPWRKDLTGDGLVYWLAVELQEARNKLDKYGPYLQRLYGG